MEEEAYNIGGNKEEVLPLLVIALLLFYKKVRPISRLSCLYRNRLYRLCRNILRLSKSPLNDTESK